MKLIFDIFLYTFEMIIAFIFISYNYDKKRSKTINILFIGFFIFLAGALILKFVNNEILNLVVFFILNLLFFIICFKITTLIISKKPGNTGISRDIRTEFTTDLLLSD